MQMETTPNGIEYDYSLSVNGAHFTLFAMNRSENAKNEAKKWLRNNRDVVSIRMAGDEEYQYKFKSQVFRDPRTKSLKYYQINEDDIPAQWNKLTPSEYVEKYVLPFTERTQARLFEKFGDKIFGL